MVYTVKKSNENKRTAEHIKTSLFYQKVNGCKLADLKLCEHGDGSVVDPSKGNFFLSLK